MANTITKVKQIKQLLDDISDNDNAVDGIISYIEALKLKNKTKTLKMLLNDFNEYKELSEIIDSLEITEHKYILAGNYVYFECEIKLYNKLLIEHYGSGLDDTLESTISYRRLTDPELTEICDIDNTTEENGYFINNEVVLNDLYNAFELNKTGKKIFKKFMCELFSLMKGI